ncbi:cytochrome b [Eikenella sp. S3360]|uniref:Cytochrome b n=1 Tax=Eikenella glucosivorans TaxID=2766967 RepID=A0ABS0N820_9NEIS|nr:cytochrome b/b6 domain-containing protein [Eikenella glucosivorans]MBH5328451.1 cytochrome b [Eikenella glucosivorans]
MQPDTPQRYGTLTRLLHWSMAACFLFMFGTAFAWNANEELMMRLINPHKAAGFLLMFLAVCRVLWALLQRQHRPANNLAAKLGHWALYALMLAVPALGIARQIGRGQDNPSLIELGNQFHGELAFVLLALVAGHIAMVVVHAVKGESVLSRMYGKS